MTDQLPPPPPAGPPPVPPPSGLPPSGPGWNGGGGWAPPKPDGPAPGVRYAGPGERLIAFLIDGIIVGIAYFALFFVLGGLIFAGAAGAAASSNAGAGAGAFFAFFAFIPLIAVGGYLIQGCYFAILWYRGGATLGMRVMNIRVVRSADGGPLTKQQAILRTFGYWVSGAVLYLGYVWILIDDHRQGWHDKIADTVVIDAR
jgi:uncharacterized RDD family membrane protein YckC